MLNPACTPWRITTILALALTGCAPLQWQKTGVTEDEMSRDQNRCAASARAEAFRQRAPFRNPAQQVVVDPQGRIIAVKPAASDTERFALEQDLIRQCMHDLGYELKPKSTSTTP